MSALLDLIRKGGPTMIAIITLSVVLYSRCFKLYLSLRAPEDRAPPPGSKSFPSASEALQRQREIREVFRHQRIALAAMIAAAPLLGLLGTVNGMSKTFESLSGKAADKSMEGLARGISEVLVSTESGLLVALPAMLFVWLAHREMLRRVRSFNPFIRPKTGGRP